MTCDLEDRVVTWADPAPMSGLQSRSPALEASTRDVLGSLGGLRGDVIGTERHHGRDALHASA